MPDIPTLEQDIATREALIDLMRAMEDAHECECDTLHLTFSEPITRAQVSVAHGIPRDVLLVGLRVMRSALVARIEKEIA